MLTALIAATALQTEAVELYRQWSPKKTLTYDVRATLVAEVRHFMTSTFIPQDLEQKYTYTFEVGDVNAEGFATVDYKRPFVMVTEGETVESPPITKKEEMNEHLVLTLSPVNAITNMKDLTPKKPDKDGGGGLRWLRATGALHEQSIDPIGASIASLYQLAMFIGNPDTSLDFGPRLPLLEVEPGDTWKVTASYQPQKLKDKKGKMAPQRLDYTYKYDGIVDSGDKKYHRVSAELHLDTDIAPFVNDLLGMTPSQSGLRGLKLKMDAKMEFDLDLETKNTVAARAESNGAFSIEVTDLQDRPVIEQKMRGRNRLKLASIK